MHNVLGVDAMGGDHGVQITVPAVLNSLKKKKDFKVVLFGDKALIEAELSRCKALSSDECDRLSIQHCTEYVGMSELPSSALRHKKDSSMRQVLDAVKSSTVDAAISAGNTGALVAISKFVLRTLEGIDRPVICSAMPTSKGRTYALDLGANLEANAQQLLQFAVMGSMLTQVLEQNEHPKVGLVNVGSEDIKGSSVIKEADALLEAVPGLNYVGYVEGNDLFSGVIDVAVMDGMVGNVALKASEGVARYIRSEMQATFSDSLWAKIQVFMAQSVLDLLVKRLSPSNYNGATLLGLNGIVVKSHGSADVAGFEQAMQVALRQVEQRILHHIQIPSI